MEGMTTSDPLDFIDFVEARVYIWSLSWLQLFGWQQPEAKGQHQTQQYG